MQKAATGPALSWFAAGAFQRRTFSHSSRASFETHDGSSISGSAYWRSNVLGPNHRFHPTSESGGIREVRWKRQGTGKSGGVRVVYFTRNEAEELVLLTLYAKSKTDKLTGDVLKEIRRALATY